MLSDHLNDDLIQEFLDGNLSVFERQQFEKHVQNCDKCRWRMEEFEELFSELNEQPEIQLSRSFTKKVVKKTRKEFVGSLQFGLMQIFFTLAFIIIAINVLFYYVELDTLKSDVQNTVNATFGFIPKMLSVFQGLLGGITSHTRYALFAAIILLMLLVADRLVFQNKHKNASYSK